VAYLRDNMKTDDNAVHEWRISINGPGQIATAMREALAERLKE
jgi:hypothetical protein